MCMFIYVCYSPVLEEIKTTYLLNFCNKTQMQAEIAVSQKRNTAMVCKFYENMSRRLWFYALHSHYHHFKPYTFDIFF